MKTYKKPNAPGTWGEHTTRSGFIRYYPLTQAMVDRRNRMAEAADYVLRTPCSYSSSRPPNPARAPFACWESEKLGPDGIANHHMRHLLVSLDPLRASSMPEGVQVLMWPEEVCVAVVALEKSLENRT